MQKNLTNIRAGTYFPRESIKSFHRATYLANNTGKITAVNIYNVPIPLTPYLDKEDMFTKLEKHTREKFEKFLNRNKITDCEIKIIRGREASVAEKLAAESERAHADMVINADKGRNVFSSLLVGSVTDEFFSRSLKIPLWISK